jgi:hypothetical protein
MRRSDGLTVSMRYDGTGQRIFKQTSGGVAEHYLMDGMETVAVLDANSDVLYWNILAGGVIGRRDASGASRYYITDHLGSVRQQVDHTVLIFGLQH